MTATTSRAGERFRTSDARGTVRIARASFAGKGRETCAVLVVLILGAAAGLVTPWAMGRSVDVVLEGGDLGDIAWLAAAMVAGTVATAALGGFGLVLTSRLFETGLARLRERMLTAAMRLPLSRIESAGSGDLVSRATDDVSQVGSAIRTAAPAISGALFTVVLTMFGLAALDWRFLLVLIVVLPVHYIGARMYTRDAPPVYRESRVAMGSVRTTCSAASAGWRPCTHSTSGRVSRDRSTSTRGGSRAGSCARASWSTACSAASILPSSSGWRPSCSWVSCSSTGML